MVVRDRARRGRFGLALSVVGAAVVVLGLVQTTSATPDYGACPSDTTLVAKFQWADGTYAFLVPGGSEDVVTVTGGTASGGGWQSDVPIVAFVVKGGDHAVLTVFGTPQTNGTFSNVGLPAAGESLPDIVNVQFCGPGDEPTTTTAEPTTSTVEPTTTTEAEPTTTTAAEPTTTTVEPTTTSVEPSTTTATPTTVASDRAEPTTTTTAAPTTTAGPTTTAAAPTSTSGAQSVAGVVVTSTSVVAATVSRGETLPFTGAPSAPILVTGVVLLVTGMTMTSVTRLQARRSGR